MRLGLSKLWGQLLEKRQRPLAMDVAAFGKMVALLGAQGKADAAIELEKLWNKLAETYSFSLHCAYPMHEEFANWQFFFENKYPIESLKRGYSDKSVFGDDFERRLFVWRLVIGLSSLRYYLAEGTSQASITAKSANRRMLTISTALSNSDNCVRPCLTFAISAS